MKRMVSIALIGLMGLLIMGCSIKRGTINSYIEPTYKQGSVKRVAVFSIRNASFAPSESRQINRDIIQSIIMKNPQIDIVSPSEALRTINEHELASDWADFVEDYYTSGIANKKILTKIAKALNVDAIMQGQMLRVNQTDGGSYSKGMTRVSISFSIIEASSAKTIWEATSDGIRGTAFDDNPAPPIADAVELAIKKINENIPHL